MAEAELFFRAGWWQYPVTFVTQGFRWLKNSCAGGGHPSLLRYNYLFPTSSHLGNYASNLMKNFWRQMDFSCSIIDDRWKCNSLLIRIWYFKKCKPTIKQSALGLSRLHLLITLIHKKIISFFRGRISNFRSVYNNDVDSIQSNMLQQIS